MALKRTKYQWRLFVPWVVLIWLVVIVLGLWMNHAEHRLRVDAIRSLVEFINARIMQAYEENLNPLPFIKFVERYYRNDSLFDEIRLSVYKDDQCIYFIGSPVSQPSTRNMKEDGVLTDDDIDFDIGEFRTRSNFYYDVMSSPDNRLKIYCILPFDDELIKASRASNNFYYTLITVALVATLLAYFMARRLGRNVSMLRDFALRAGTDPSFVPSTDFSHDELGDIARQIVRFYNGRNKSLLKLKREHQVAIQALEDKTRLKRELTNNINHELKTPIGVIKGYIDTMKEHPDMDEGSRQHFLSKVSEHVERLTQLLNDLSSITRLEYGSDMINTEPIDFHEIAFQVVNDIETSGIMGNMEFNYDIPTYCRVVGNAGLLSAMIANLAKNAVLYSKGTECNLILTDKDDEFYHFAFYDDGVGVKESSLPHLFERFFREDSGRSRKKGGTGLGLCIVRNTVEALGGTISVSNREGGGLLFRFTLRRVKEN